MSELVPNPTLTREQVQGALALAGLRPVEGSPFLELVTEAAPSLGPSDWQALREAGLLEAGEPPRLTAQAVAGLRAFCQPRVRASLLLGTRDSLFATQFYSANGFDDGELASYVADPAGTEFGLVLGQSPSTLADALAAQLLVGAMDQAVPFRTELGPDAFVALLSILDRRLQAVLAAALDRSPEPEPLFRAQAIWETLAEGRTAEDLSWQVTLFTYILPFLDYGLDTDRLEVALLALGDQGLVIPTGDGRYRMSEPLLELADALPPVVSFAALSVEAQDEAGEPSTTHLAFVRGRSATLMVQPAGGAEGTQALAVDSLDGVELGELLFSLGLPGQRLAGIARTAPEPEATLTADAGSVPGQAGWQVAVLEGADAGRTFPLGDRVTMGRMPGNDIALNDALASRHHAVIERIGPGYQIEDLGSSNGTYVNGARIAQPTALRAGDTIAIGDTRLAVRAAGPQGDTFAAQGTVVCPSCGAAVLRGNKFCTRCGTPLAGLGERRPQ